MQAEGEVFHDPHAPEGESLGRAFWDEAVVVPPKAPTSVHLKLDPEVFDFFKRGGKGHLTRMQNVLKAYVEAQRRKAG
jgi:uncharacterized protein (DUF4415 family)